jgi:hypothetical protein
MGARRLDVERTVSEDAGEEPLLELNTRYLCHQDVDGLTSDQAVLTDDPPVCHGILGLPHPQVSEDQSQCIEDQSDDGHGTQSVHETTVAGGVQEYKSRDGHRQHEDRGQENKSCDPALVLDHFAWLQVLLDVPRHSGFP